MKGAGSQEQTNCKTSLLPARESKCELNKYRRVVPAAKGEVLSGIKLFQKSGQRIWADGKTTYNGYFFKSI